METSSKKRTGRLGPSPLWDLVDAAQSLFSTPTLTRSLCVDGWMDQCFFGASVSQNRVAMRFLCGHYLALSSPQRAGFVGLVQRGVSLAEIARVGVV